jgi:uncharacterized protein (DUF2147 family)
MAISSTENNRCDESMWRLALDLIVHQSIGLTMLHGSRNITRIVTYSAIFLGAALAPALAADPTGDWKVADGVASIRVAECNGSMWGVVAWEQIPGGHDTNNPDVAKQSRLTLGMPILIDMKKKPGVDKWEGQVYNAKDGKSYSSTIKPVGSDQLEIQGCVMGFLCGGETWTRVAGPIPSSPTNSMAKGPAKPATTAVAAQPKAALPKTTGSVSATAKTPGQKIATTTPAAATPADPVGDICLIPDIARFAH